MTPHASDHDHEAVLRHLAWVQRLAAQVCVDAAQAEDVSQESILAAFEQDRPRGVPLRHWLGGVVRNQARMALRRARRRPGIEARGARPGAEPSAGDIVERAATQRAVVEAVLALEEPYRTTLLERYFDERSPTEIAATHGIPLATVKTRLRRGLERLRTALQRSLGNDENPHAYLLVLVPLAGMELRRQGAGWATSARLAGSHRPPVLSSAVRSIPFWAMAAFAFVAFAAAVFAWPRTPNPSTPVDPAPAIALRPPIEDSPPKPIDAARRVELARNPFPAAVHTDRLAVRIRVLDMDGRACPDVTVSAAPFDAPPDNVPTELGSTGPLGELRTTVAANLQRIFVPTGHWITVLSGTVFPSDPSAETPVVVARPRAVRGIVTGPDGAPLADARLLYRTYEDLRGRFSIPVDQVGGVEWTTRSAADGTFAFEQVPALPGAQLEVQAWGCETVRVAVAASGTAWVPCSLAACSAATTWIHGSVRSAAGQPLAHAAVSLGAYAVRARADGRFRIDRGASPDAVELLAACPGFAPQRAPRPTDGWPRHIDLVLQPATHALTGVVVDQHGQPRPGVVVDLADPTPFGMVRNDPFERYEIMTLEGFMASGPTRVRTAADGSFRIDGLTARSYRIAMHDPVGLDAAALGPFAPDARRLRLTLPSEADHVSVAGKVVDTDGQPIRAVRLTLRRRLGATTIVGPSASSDATGAFAFERPVSGDVTLHAFAGGSYAMAELPLSSRADPEDLTVSLRRVASFYLQALAADHAADRFVLERLDGTPVPLQQVDLSGAFTLEIGTLDIGRSAVHRVPTGSYTLSLRHGDRELERIPLELHTGPPLCVTF